MFPTPQMTICVRRRPVQPLASASEELTRGFLSDPETESEESFGHVVAVEGRDVLLAREGDRLLSLNHFHIVRHTSGEAIARLHKLLGRQVTGLRCNLELVATALQIE